MSTPNTMFFIVLRVYACEIWQQALSFNVLIINLIDDIKIYFWVIKINF